MKNTLIINLKRFGDVLTTAHLVNSYMSRDPHSKVSLLIFKEFERAAKNIANVENIYTIDREKFLTFSKNKIFSNAFSLNLFANEIEEIKSTSWDEVFNYSNDRISTHICSFLKSNSRSTVGLSFSNSCTVEYGSEWDILFNDVLTSVKYSPINFVDNYHKMANLIQAPRGVILKTNESHNHSAFTNFNEIRKSNNGQKKIIGIQLFASSSRKEMDYSETVKLIDSLAADERYCPVLISAPLESERQRIKDINYEFNNTLISIEADFLALNSVLMNLDLLITPDTAIKHAADLLNTPTIELSMGESPLFKQGITNEDSVILSKRVDQRLFSIKEITTSQDSIDDKINHRDIISAVNYILEGENLNNASLSKNISVYAPVKDKLGTQYRLMAGFEATEAEFMRLLDRQYINLFFGLGEDVDIFEALVNLSSKKVKDLIDREKNNLTLFTKDLLGTLRSLMQAKGTANSEFVQNLGKILSYCEESTLLSIPSIIFRARLESINTTSATESTKEIEGLLYELKADIQKLHKTLKSFEEFNFTKQKEDRINSRKESVTTL